MTMYAIVIKFPHENQYEDDETVLTSVIGSASSQEEAYKKLNEIQERFEKEVRVTNRSKEYIIGLIALPQYSEDFERAIKYNIEKASYSY